MVKQFNPELPFKEEEWISAASLSPDVRALVGRIHDLEGWRHRYVGITEDTVIWDVSTEVESHEYLLHDVHYGNYSSDAASQIGMLRYFEKSDRSGGRVDTWVVDASFSDAPREVLPVVSFETAQLRCVHIQFVRSDNLHRSIDIPASHSRTNCIQPMPSRLLSASGMGNGTLPRGAMNIAP
jgi:hypothetical protein